MHIYSGNFHMEDNIDLLNNVHASWSELIPHIVGTSISRIRIDMNPIAKEYLVLVDCLEVIDSMVLDHLLEGLSNLIIEWYKAVSQILYTKC